MRRCAGDFLEKPREVEFAQVCGVRDFGQAQFACAVVVRKLNGAPQPPIYDADAPAIGIYGVISYTVVQRTGEFGIRLALGAQPKDVLWLVLRNGGRLILLGAVLGLGGAYAVARLLAATLPTLPTRDPVTLVIITLTLVVVALVAGGIPARRATKVDPMIALRCE